MSLILALFGILLLCFGILVYILWYKYTGRYSSIYCPYNIPIFGSVLHFEHEHYKLVQQIYHMIFVEGHRFYVLWFAWKAVIFTGQINITETLLKSKTHITKSNLYSFLHEWLATGLLTSTRNKWHQRRRILTPSFHFSKILNFTETFEQKGNKFVEYLSNYAKSGKPLDIQIPSSLMALESICKTAMGVELDSLDSNSSQYVDAVRSINSQIHYRMRSPWVWPSFLYRLTKRGQAYYKNLDLLHNFTMGVINERVKSYTVNEKLNEVQSISNNIYYNNDKTDFLEGLLKLYKQGEIDIEGMREEVDTFMFEGHDTTAALVAWCLFALGNNISCQEKLQNEIDNAEGETIFMKLKDCNYLENVIKESLRLYPPVPNFGRHIEKDTVIDGYKIYQGTQIVVDAYSLHRNEAYWSNPYEFNPNRFNDDEYVNRNPYSYIPFSAGPRNCIGQKYALLEAKYFIFSILKNYNIKSLETEASLKMISESILRSKDGLLVEISYRR